MSDILLTEQTSASATPAAGRVVIYPKNDGYLYFKNDTGVETRVNPQTVATAAGWTSANPTLAAGVFGVESDTMKFKIGDGATAWTALAYWRYTAEHISIATTGGDTVLTIPQSRASSMAVTGVLVSNVTITTPDIMALFVAENLTTGAFTVTFKTAAGSGVAIEQGEHAILYADGTNIEKPDPSGVGSNLTLARIAGSTYSTIQHWRNNLASAGIVSGGVISDAGGATINVTGGSCTIRPTTSHNSTLYFADFPANNGIAIPANTIRYVGIEYNAGSPIIAIRTTDNFDYMTNFPVGVVVNEAGTIHVSIADRHDVTDSASHTAERFEHTASFARDEVLGGLILGETGTRNITMSAGAVWQKLTKLIISAFNSSTGGTFDIYYRDGASSFTKVPAATQWPNLQYDNNTGTLATLANNKFGVLWFYLEPDDGMVIMLYGRVEHGSIAAAEAEAPPATVPNRIAVGGKLIGRLVFAKSAAAASSISSVFTTTFSSGGAASHANLSNLDYASAGHTGFVATTSKGVANGVASLDASALIPITQIPPAAMERLVVVANQAARYALTTASVQLGDTVKQTDTGEMWYVIDEANLGNSAGYAVYTAGTASAVAVGGITGLGTGVATALAVAVGSAGAVVVNGGALGTPSSGALDNCTSNTETAANNSTQLATTAYADRLTAGTLAGAFTTVTTPFIVSSTDVVDVSRTHASTTAQIGIFDIRAICTGDMVDGYGAQQRFAIQDNAGVNNVIATISGVRKGADNAGALLVNVGAGAGTQSAEFSSTGLAVTGRVDPSAHNTYDLGTTGVRWKDLWLQSGAFNGSDARLKTAIAPLTANEINAAKQLSKEIGTYQWLESIQKKGDAARHHVGFTVQRAIEILQANKCDPFRYGFIGYDKWDDVFVEHAEILPVAAVEAKDAVLDADGNIVEPAVVAAEEVVGKAAWTEHKTVAGDAYSFRYDQLNMFIAAGLEARLSALEAK